MSVRFRKFIDTISILSLQKCKSLTFSSMPKFVIEVIRNKKLELLKNCQAYKPVVHKVPKMNLHKHI